jgi:two-component system, NarL family, sensor histidine kinase UhpB
MSIRHRRGTTAAQFAGLRSEGAGAPGAELPATDFTNTSRRRREDALRRLNAALEAQARSIGQALHDETGQTLAAAYLSLAEAIEIAPASVGEHLAAVRRHLEHVETQLRRVAHELRPRILDDLGLVPALKFLANGISLRAGITVEVAFTVTGAVPAPVETAVYRFVQESITNISRHAKATRVVLALQEWPGLLRCEVSDNGMGFEGERRSASGLGLVGIRDRLDALGGTLTVRSAPGEGTQLVAVIPLEDRHVGSRSDGRRSSGGARRVPRHPRTR